MPTSPRPGGFKHMPGWMGKCYFTLFHSTNRCNYVRFRVDVGIDPYIETIRAFHSTCRVVPVRGGRLVAAPTGAASFIIAVPIKESS